MSNDALIDELSSGLVPVRPRNVAREAAWLAGLGVLELIIFLALGMMRPDMAAVIGQPFMWWKLGSLALLVAISGGTAVQSFSPTISPRRGLILTAGLAGAVVAAGLALGLVEQGAPGLSERLMPAHGLLCAGSIVVLSLPMLVGLSVFMRRGASAHAEGSALAVGLAGGSWGALVFAFCCPVNDPVYILFWYSAAFAITASLARLVLPRFAAL
ncbi:NrsF family protein [Roseomonas elaeocarpi]|uniref:NrsF family protein n=1 Tax=Roseomonas elaeocarpi TaxID=907779 RepID=A0ABV6JN89_9PROT